jgi:transcriptional regulator with XRE-family HTH domain
MGKPNRPDDIKQQIGLRLRAARLALGFTDLASFANSLGVSETALGNYERGDRLADVLVMARMFDRHGVTLEWIYNGSLRGMDRALQDALEEQAAKLGAVVGGTVARWPMAEEHRATRPAAVPKVKNPSGQKLHESQDTLAD